MASSRPSSRILVVDDEESIRDLLERILTGEGYNVTLASSGEQAIDLLGADTFDLIITDSKMPGVGGLAVLAAANRVDPPLPVIVISSGPHHQDSGEAKIRESTAGVSRKPSSDGKARGCSSKHLCGLTAWNT